MDLTFLIRWVTPEKKRELIDWGRGTARRQNINFLIALGFCRSKCHWHKAHAAYTKPRSFPFLILETLWALFWLHTEKQMYKNDCSFGTGAAGPYNTIYQMSNYSPSDRPLEQQCERPRCSLRWHSKTQYLVMINKFVRDLINLHLQQPRSFSFNG